MTTARRTLVLLALAITILASACFAHALFSAMQSHGWVQGSYATYQHQAFFSVLISTTIVALLLLLIIGGESLSAGVFGGRDWLVVLARETVALSPGLTFIWVLAGQLAAIAAIESLEQTVAFGHPLGADAVIGAPIFIALVVHASCAFAMTAVLLRGARGLLRVRAAFLAIVAPLVRRVRIVDAAEASRSVEKNRQPIVRPRAPLALKIANRPPPHPLTA